MGVHNSEVKACVRDLECRTADERTEKRRNKTCRERKTEIGVHLCVVDADRLRPREGERETARAGERNYPVGRENRDLRGQVRLRERLEKKRNSDFRTGGEERERDWGERSDCSHLRVRERDCGDC